MFGVGPAGRRVLCTVQGPESPKMAARHTTDYGGNRAHQLLNHLDLFTASEEHAVRVGVLADPFPGGGTPVRPPG